MFIVVQVPSTYNAILRHPKLNQLDVVMSSKHLLICFLTLLKIGKVRGDK